MTRGRKYQSSNPESARQRFVSEFTILQLSIEILVIIFYIVAVNTPSELTLQFWKIQAIAQGLSPTPAYLVFPLATILIILFTLVLFFSFCHHFITKAVRTITR